MDFVILMTMIGIISLAGIVVNNAIVLIDYINLIEVNAEAVLDTEFCTNQNYTFISLSTPGTYVWEITAYNDCGETDVLATRTWVINSSGGGDF